MRNRKLIHALFLILCMMICFSFSAAAAETEAETEFQEKLICAIKRLKKYIRV